MKTSNSTSPKQLVSLYMHLCLTINDRLDMKITFYFVGHHGGLLLAELHCIQMYFYNKL